MKRDVRAGQRRDNTHLPVGDAAHVANAADKSNAESRANRLFIAASNTETEKTRWSMTEEQMNGQTDGSFSNASSTIHYIAVTIILLLSNRYAL